ncbi:MAG: monovalent cation/H+ antiporter subunit D [Gammaproteobacteria bacterium]
MIAPVLLPAFAAMACVLAGGRLGLQRVIALTSSVALVLLAAALLAAAADGGWQVYRLGDWPAPFGIVLVLDRLSALMLLLTALVVLAACASALQGTDARGSHFHALLLFQTMGVNGAFLTGDLFNLFVFFEVLLIASYGLLTHGGGALRLRAGMHYVVINLTGSALFLIAVSLLYGVTGTLNLADLSQRAATLPESDAALLRAAGLLLFGVFAIKAAAFPLYFWLPSAYSAAAAPVAAAFAIMTKVGIYAIIRVSEIGFGDGAGLAANLAQDWLLPAGLATLALGAIGALAATHLRGLLAYLTVASVGTLLVAAGLASAAALAAGLYYMVHSTLTVAALFLVAELIARSRGEAADRLKPGGVTPPTLQGLLFLVGAVAVAGLPPLPGFLGKVLLLDAAIGRDGMAWVWAVVLASGLIAVIALARAGSLFFWKTRRDMPQPGAASALQALPAVALIALVLLLSVFAGPAKRYADATVAQLANVAGYRAAVLDGGAQ